MNIDYQAIMAQLTALIQGMFIKELPLVETVAASYLSSTEARLKALAINAASGKLDKSEVLEALKDEAGIFVSEAKSFEIMGLEMTQEVLNNAKEVVIGIISNVVPALKKQS